MIYITDYINDFSIEKKILKNSLITYKDKKINFSSVKVIIVWHEKINKEFLKQFPNTKAVIRYGVGYDNVDVNYLKKKKIIFCNNPDYGVEEVSNTALAMALSFLRKIYEYDILSKKLLLKKNNEWQEKIFKNTLRLSKIKVGVIGAGRIGSAFIHKSKEIFPNISFYDPNLPLGYEKIFNCNRHYNLDNLLKNSDLITIHAPLIKETKNLINKNNIKLLKKNVVIINTARGGIIEDIDIFYDKFIKNEIGGLGIDVFKDEPPNINKSKILKLWIKNDKRVDGKIIINPHVSYYSQDSYKEMRKKAAFLAFDAMFNKIYNNRII